LTKTSGKPLTRHVLMLRRRHHWTLSFVMKPLLKSWDASLKAKILAPGLNRSVLLLPWMERFLPMSILFNPYIII
jgi:hypothetical protein